MFQLIKKKKLVFIKKNKLIKISKVKKDRKGKIVIFHIKINQVMTRVVKKKKGLKGMKVHK